MATYANIYDNLSVKSVRGATVVELISENNEVAQIALLPDGDGFLIRVWGANQRHEYGGDNLNAFRATLKFGGSEAFLTQLDHVQDWGAREKEES